MVTTNTWIEFANSNRMEHMRSTKQQPPLNTHKNKPDQPTICSNISTAVYTRQTTTSKKEQNLPKVDNARQDPKPQLTCRLRYGYGERVPPPIDPSVNQDMVVIRGGETYAITDRLNKIISGIIKDQSNLNFMFAIPEALYKYYGQFGCPETGVSIVYHLEYNKKRSCESWDEINERQKQLSMPGCRPTNPMKYLKYVGWSNKQRGIHIGITFDQSPLRFSEGQMFCCFVPV